MSQGFQGGPPPQTFAAPPANFPGATPPGLPTAPAMAQPMHPAAVAAASSPQFAPPAFPAAQVPPAAPQPVETAPFDSPVPFAAPPALQPSPPPPAVAFPMAQATPPSQPAPQPASPPAASGPRAEIMTLLKQFAKREGCERYSADSDKIRLLTDYFWLRQLTPQLPFETFLDLYSRVADFDEENLKHPEDAIKKLLPRAKKQAEEMQTHQWAAKELVDFLALYVDVIREAESQGQPVPLTLAQFIGNKDLQTAYLRGDFKSHEPATRETSTKRETRPAKETPTVRPTAAEQRVIYTKPNKLEERGVTTRVFESGEDGRQYADLRLDSGEEIFGVGIIHLRVVEDPRPNPPQTDEGTEKPELGYALLRIPKADGEQAKQYLASPGKLGTVAVGDPCMNPFAKPFDGTPYAAAIYITNGENKPYVDAVLVENDWTNVVFDVPPRENLEGTYLFDLPHGYFRLEVRINE